jgi:hypothetical protein
MSDDLNVAQSFRAARLLGMAMKRCRCEINEFCLPCLKETFFNTERAFIAKEALKRVYGVSLYRGSINLMVATVTITIAGLSFWMVAGSLYPAESAESVELALAAISAISLLALPSTLDKNLSLSTFARS